MNTELPAPEDYYRLTRARELREKADRLEARVALLEKWTRSPTRLPLIILCPTLFLVVGRWLWKLDHLYIYLIVLGFPVAVTAPERVRRRADELREEADHLEAEHQARYGELPTGEE
jgi:hypothetical protein